MDELSVTELMVAECYGKGFIDKEAAKELDKPLWTVKTHKKHIFQKLGINTTHELVIFLMCRKLGKPFDLNRIRKEGLSAILSVLLLVVSSVDYRTDIVRARTQRTSVSRMMRRGRDGVLEEDLYNENNWQYDTT